MDPQCPLLFFQMDSPYLVLLGPGFLLAKTKFNFHSPEPTKQQSCRQRHFEAGPSFVVMEMLAPFFSRFKGKTRSEQGRHKMHPGYMINSEFSQYGRNGIQVESRPRLL